MPATREYQFISGPETSTLPTAGTPSNDADTITKGYADDKYVQGGDPVADVTALKAIAAADRTDNDVLFVDSLNTLFYFDSGSSATGDDLTVIAPDAGTGRWLRVNQQPYITTAAHFRNQAEARFYEQSGNGTNYTAITGPDDANNSNVTFKLPSADGSSGQALLTNGSAVLGWGNPSAGNNDVSSKSADYTILDDDNIYLVVMTTSTTDRTVTLPTLADNIGRRIAIMKADSASGSVTIDGEGAETINGLTTVAMFDQYDLIEVVGVTGGWMIIRTEFSGWKSFTPTGGWSTNTTYTGWYKRNADTLYLRVTINLSGGPNAATLSYTIPNSWTIDTTKITSTSNNRVVGTLACECSGSAYVGRIKYSSTSSVIGTTFQDNPNGVRETNCTHSVPEGFTSGDELVAEFSVPLEEFDLG